MQGRHRDGDGSVPRDDFELVPARWDEGVGRGYSLTKMRRRYCSDVLLVFKGDGGKAERTSTDKFLRDSESSVSFLLDTVSFSVDTPGTLP